MQRYAGLVFLPPDLPLLQAALVVQGRTLLQGDPTGMSSVWGKVVIAAGLVVVITLAIRFFWDQRNR